MERNLPARIKAVRTAREVAKTAREEAKTAREMAIQTKTMRLQRIRMNGRTLMGTVWVTIPIMTLMEMVATMLWMYSLLTRRSGQTQIAMASEIMPTKTRMAMALATTKTSSPMIRLSGRTVTVMELVITRTTTHSTRTAIVLQNLATMSGSMDSQSREAPKIQQHWIWILKGVCLTRAITSICLGHHLVSW